MYKEIRDLMVIVLKKILLKEKSEVTEYMKYSSFLVNDKIISKSERLCDVEDI